MFNEYYRDDIQPRCYQTCKHFKLLMWCGKTNFIGTCINHKDVCDPKCKFWESDGLHHDPSYIDKDNQLLIFQKEEI